MIAPLVFNLLQVKMALGIEVDTGLRHSQGSVLKVAKQRFGCVSNTKTGALAEVKAMWDGVMYVRETAKWASDPDSTIEQKPPLPKIKEPKLRNAFVRGVALETESEPTMEVFIA